MVFEAGRRDEHHGRRIADWRKRSPWNDLIPPTPIPAVEVTYGRIKVIPRVRLSNNMKEPPMKRLVLAIVVGFFTAAVLSALVDHIFHTTGFFPPYGQPFRETGPVVVAFTYRAVFVVFATFLAAVIARERAKRAVLILGSIGSFLWLVGALNMWDFAPAWYHLLGIGTGIPLAIAGGKLYEIRARSKGIVIT
jgi:hypothetical protein